MHIIYIEVEPIVIILRYIKEKQNLYMQEYDLILCKSERGGWKTIFIFSRIDIIYPENKFDNISPLNGETSKIGP